MTAGEPLFCNFCGRSYDLKLCPHRHPNPRNEEDVEKGLGGNLCRCGTYVGIRKAVLEASREMKGGRNA